MILIDNGLIYHNTTGTLLSTDLYMNLHVTEISKNQLLLLLWRSITFLTSIHFDVA